jgi:hypothetical protein
MCLAIAGCSSPDPYRTVQVFAPSLADWAASFSRLDAAEQALIKENPERLGPAASVIDGVVSNPDGIHKLLDLPAICDGYNSAFGKTSNSAWEVENTISIESVITPAGIQTHRFDLIWKFHNADGRSVKVLAAAEGPGINIIWGPSREAMKAEENQAFALAFLKLVIQIHSAPPR